jgi:hypothetical protein
MKTIKPQIIAALIALAVLASGCVIVAGNKGNPKSGATLGQQLVDLKKAKEAGVITDTEYEVQKQKLLEEEKKK